VSSPKDDYVPLSSLPPLLVHSCDGCGGTLLLDPDNGWTPERLEYSNNTFGVYIFCKTCQAKEDKREAAVVVQKNTRCVHKLYPGGAFSDLVVTAVDGERITVAVLGLGGVEPERQREILGQCWPGFLLSSNFVFPRSDLLMKGL
jgi:hypothetical protein